MSQYVTALPPCARAGSGTKRRCCTPERGPSRRRAGAAPLRPGPTALASRWPRIAHFRDSPQQRSAATHPLMCSVCAGSQVCVHAVFWRVDIGSSASFHACPAHGRCGTWRLTSASRPSSGHQAASRAAARRRNRTSSGRPSSSCTSAGAALCGCVHARARARAAYYGRPAPFSALIAVSNMMFTKRILCRFSVW